MPGTKENMRRFEANEAKVKANWNKLLAARIQEPPHVNSNDYYDVSHKQGKHTTSRVRSYVSYDESTFKEKCMDVSYLEDMPNGTSPSDHGLYWNLKTLFSGWVWPGTAVRGRRSSAMSVEETNEKTTKDKVYFPFYLNGELPEFFVKKAEKELGETPENRQKALQELRDMIRAENKPFPTDDNALLMYLRCRKFDVKRAFRVMENFEIYKQIHHDVYPFSKQDAQRELDAQYIHILPYRDAEGRGIIYINSGLAEPGRIPLMEGLTFGILMFLKFLEEPANQIAGIVCIGDAANVSMKWMKLFSLTYARALKFLYMDCMPCRYKGMHILNENVMFRFAYQLFEKLLPKKFRSRLHVYGSDGKKLLKYFPPNILPVEYGGELENWKSHYIVEEFLNPVLLGKVETRKASVG